MVASEQHLYQTIVLERKLATGSIHDYLFCYCPLVGILFKVLRINTNVLCLYAYHLLSMFGYSQYLLILVLYHSNSMLIIQLSHLHVWLNISDHQNIKMDECP